MPPATLADPVTSASNLSQPDAQSGHAAGHPVDAAPLARLRVALEACALPTVSSTDWADLRAALREVSLACVAWPRAQAKAPFVGEAATLLRAAAAAGAMEVDLSAGDVAAARAALPQGWSGLLAAMFLVPAWELPETPRLDDVPAWLWGDYVAWLFAAPRQFASAERAATIAAQQLPRLEELNSWLQRNAGAAAVRAAGDALVTALSSPLARAAQGRRAAELRGLILTRLLVPKTDRDFRSPLSPRAGRRLYVGFVGEDFGGCVDTFAALGLFASIDASAFEITLFSRQTRDTTESRFANKRAAAEVVLTGDVEAQVEQVRRSRLDVVVFCGEVGAKVDALTQLALRRLAPLQVVMHRTGATTGLPEIDLYVSAAQPATDEAAAAFTERLGLMRGPAQAFVFPGLVRGAPLAVARADLGLPDDAVVFAAIVEPGRVTQETVRAWAAVLTQTPTARLALALVTTEAQGEGPGVARFCRELEQAFVIAGADVGQVAVFPATPGQPDELRNLLRLADLFLAPLGDAQPTWLAEALALGVPSLVRRENFNADLNAATIGLVCSLGLEELVADTACAYLAKATALAADAGARTALGQRLADALDGTPEFLDSLASADAFGALLETAYDELAALDRTAFRAERAGLRCFSAENLEEELDAGFAALANGDSAGAAFETNLALRADPAQPRTRYLKAQVLLAEGKTARAIDYLMAALPHFGNDGGFWFTLAKALRQNGQLPQAIEALEACLRVGGQQPEPLRLLVELAHRAGATELAEEAQQCLDALAPAADEFASMN